MNRWNIGERAARVHAGSVVWDDHSGFMPVPDADLPQLQRWIDSGINYISIDVSFDALPREDAIKTIAAYRVWFEKHPGQYRLVETADDILRAKQDGKLAITFDIEGMNALDGDVNMVSLFYRLGVRQMLFAYNLNNEAGGGCHDDDQGLTAFGRDVIEEMNRVGMMVDCTHCGKRTALEAMATSQAPTIFSHSNMRALYDHERNIPDELIKACAKTGGVVGINGAGNFLDDVDAKTESMVRHIAHVADLVGPQHVGIGLDYDWDRYFKPVQDKKFWPAGRGYENRGNFKDASPEQLPQLTEALLDRGFSEDNVRGIMGGNFLRLAREVWK
ncbi:MAG TPA: dipeptidase [Dongiaceae bacterium]